MLSKINLIIAEVVIFAAIFSWRVNIGKKFEGLDTLKAKGGVNPCLTQREFIELPTGGVCAIGLLILAQIATVAV